MPITIAGRIAGRCVLWLLVACALMVISGHLYIAYWSFPMSDDYSNAWAVHESGIWGYTTGLYRTWCGRYASNFSISAFTHLFFPYGINPFIFAHAVCFLGILFVFLRRIGLRHAVAAAIIDIGVFLLVLPDSSKTETLYWFTAGFNYIMPAIVLLAGILWLWRFAKPDQGWRLFFPLGLVVFIVGGCSEQLTLAMIAMPAVFCALNVKDRSSLLWRVMFCVMCASVLAMAGMVVSPGNHVRRSFFTAGGELGLGEIAWKTLLALEAPLKASFLPLLLYGCLRGIFLPYRPLPISHTHLVAYAASLCAVVYALYLGVVYGMNGHPVPGRCNFAPILLCLVAVPLIMGDVWRRVKPCLNPHMKMCAVGALSVAAVFFLPPVAIKAVGGMLGGMERAPRQHNVAMLQISMAKEAVRNGVAELVVPAVPEFNQMPMGISLMEDPENYMNRGFASYFGLSKVVAK